MALRGRVSNGVVVLDEGNDLPDGTEVRVEPVDPQRSMTLAERFQDVIGKAQDLPADMAAQHDHYIHGASKR